MKQPRSRTNRKRGQGSGEDRRVRSQVVREWIGAPQPLDLNKNISEASEWIETILEKIGVSGGIEEERVIETWRELAGELVAGQTAPVSLRRGCLTLKVLQPSMRFHLEQLKPQLLRKLQQELGEEHLKSLRLTIG